MRLYRRGLGSDHCGDSKSYTVHQTHARHHPTSVRETKSTTDPVTRKCLLVPGWPGWPGHTSHMWRKPHPVVRVRQGPCRSRAAFFPPVPGPAVTTAGKTRSKLRCLVNRMCAAWENQVQVAMIHLPCLLVKYISSGQCFREHTTHTIQYGG